MVATIFIDGEAGTTGLSIRERLADRKDLQVIGVDADRRRDLGVRRDMLNVADVVILCLPDEAAREAVALIENPSVKVIDASSAHRTAPGWTYGFPEMTKAARADITEARRVSNPGCWPTGAIALLRPLVEAGLAPASGRVLVHGVSGYSGGGRSMIAEFEDPASGSYTTTPYRPYALAMGHKHLPEMQLYGGFDHAPLFAPAVGRFRQGMIVEATLPLDALPKAPRLDDLRDCLAAAYAGERFVTVASAARTEPSAVNDPQRLNGTDSLELFVFGSDSLGQARLVALLDNLGKGAGGAAVQNLNLMLGLEEGAGLITHV
jgi:N-acetyl-gamma-glutamyl-phosphate reductase